MGRWLAYHYTGYRNCLLPLSTAVTCSKRGSKTAYSGNFSYKDDFTAPTLIPDWVYLRTPAENWWNLSRKKGWLALQVRPQTAGGRTNPSFVGRRQQHMQFEASTAVQFAATDSMEKAGLIAFQNDNHFYFLCRSVSNGNPVVQLYQSGKDRGDSNRMFALASAPLKKFSPATLHLKISGNKNKYSFYYAENNTWKTLKADVDGRFLSTKEAGGFVGTFIGLYATAMGQQSSKMAFFDWFSYTGKDDLYEEAHK